MKITVLRNVGTADLKKIGTDRNDLTEGNEVDVEKAVAEKLIAVGLAEAIEVKGEAKAPEIKGDKK